MKNWIYLLFVVSIGGLIGCQSEDEKRYEQMKEESKKTISEAMSAAIIKGYLKPGESSDIIRQWSEIDAASAVDGLAYSRKIKRIVDGGRAPYPAEWRVSPFVSSAPAASELTPVDSIAQKDRIAKIDRLKKAMRKSVDDMKNQTWYYAPTTTKFIDRNSFHLYMGEKEGQVWLRFRIQYAADDWLFIKRYIVKVDSSIYNVIPASAVETDNGAGLIWETFDEGVTPEYMEMLREIVSAKTVKLRCEGSQYYRDRVLSASEKKAIGQVLDLYNTILGGPGS
jgi:hypothetical protein